MGVETPELNSASTVTELIGNKDGNTVRIAANALAAQLSLDAIAVNKETRAQLYADLAWAAGTRASVWGDPNEGYRGIYLKSGAAGGGGWSRIGDLPQSALTASQLAGKADQSALIAEAEARQAVEKLGDTIRLTSIGGTGDAVTASVPSAQSHIDLVVGQTLEWRQPADNTGAATMTVGSTVFELQSLVGAPLVAGALRSGARYRGVVQQLGATNRIRLHQSVSAADLVETTDAKIMTSAEREKLGRIDFERGTVETYLWLEADAQDRFVRGMRADMTMWEARDGEIVQIARPDVISADGFRRVSKIEVAEAIKLPIASGLWMPVARIGDWDKLECDQDGRFVRGVKFDKSEWRAEAGMVVQVSDAQAAVVASAYSYARATGTTFLSDITTTDYLVLINGQSWALGADNGSTGNVTISGVAQHPGNALMPTPGVRPSGAGFTAYADLREIASGGVLETPHSGMADVIMSRLNSRLGFKPRVIFASAASGGQAYWDARAAPNTGLKRGTSVYAEAMRIIDRCTAISRAAGRRLVVLAQVIVHGEQDFTDGTSREAYQRALDQWNAHINEDWRRITGQPEPIRTYVSQVQRGGSSIGTPAQVALAQLAAQERNPLIRCVGPVYQGPGGQPQDGNDGAHLKPLGYRMIGRLFGHFIVEDLLGPYEEPLRVIDRWWVSATEIRLKYSKPIAVETTNALVNVLGITVGSNTYAGLGADGGVKFTDGSASPPTVTGLAVTDGSTLICTLSAAPVGKNPRLTIAGLRPGGSGSGAERGARSAIRSAEAFDADPLTGVTQYHWACQEQIILPIFA